VHRGGSVLIPAFAADRTTVLLMALREVMGDGREPTVPVFVDSPMALAALEVCRRAMHGGSPEVRPYIGGDPFDPGILRVARSVAESTALSHHVA
jgi:metallo-beta-lactamase family protein